MRVPVLLLMLLLAGCASPDAPDPDPATLTPGAPTTPMPDATVTPGASPGATPAASSTATPSATASPAPSVTPPAAEPEVALGVVLDESHDYAAGGRKMSFFNVTGGESKVVIDIDSAGPPADGSFQSAVVDFYFPGSTSPFVAELPGQEARSFTIEQQPHQGMWRVVYDGVGKTNVHIRVTLQ